MAGFVIFVVLASLLGVVISGASYQTEPLGLPDAGPVIGWALPIVNSAAFICAFLVIGWLLLAAILDADNDSEVVSRRGRRSLVLAGTTACIWCVASLASAAVTMANVLGVPITQVLTPNAVTSLWWPITDIRTKMICAGLALIIGIGCFFTAKLTSATGWLVLALVAISTPALAGHAAGLGDHTLAIVSSVMHVLAAALWVGGLIALAATAWPKGAPLGRAVKRFSPLAAVCVGLLLVSGIANAYARLAEPADLYLTGYGRLVLIKSLLLLVLIVSGYMMRQRIIPSITDEGSRTGFVKLAVGEIAIMALATGFGVALAISAPTRPELWLSTPGEQILGFEFPPEPTLSNVIFGLHLNALFLTLGLAGIAVYLVGVNRLRQRGDKWPLAQTISWIIGMLIMIWATNSGIALYSEVSVGMHMIEHMTLTMIAPIPIVLAAPITLALRALKPAPSGGRGPRELLLAALHSKWVAFLTNPLIVLAIYAFGLYGIYYTSLFGSMMASHIGHIFMTLHFLLSGLLLTWVVIGLDPQPRKLPYWAKILLVLVAVVLHTFFALSMMSTTNTFGEEWYGLVRPPWLTDAVGDSALAGQVAWSVGEIPAVVLLLIIAYQWFKSDTREAKRRDRFTEVHGDKELDDYNEYLKALNDRANRGS